MAKAALITKGKQNYMNALKRLGGALAYRECGELGGMDTTICLKGLKAKLTESDWGNAWAQKMGIERAIEVIMPVIVPIKMPAERIPTIEEKETLLFKSTDTEKQKYWKKRYERLGKSERIYREQKDITRLKEIMTRREKLLTLLKMSYA